MEQKTGTLESQGHHGSSRLEKRPSINHSAASTNDPDKIVRRKKKIKSTLHGHNSSLWRNISFIFSPKTSSCANVRVIKDKESPIRRFSSFFKLKKAPINTIKPLTNIGVSPKGYQVAVSETNFEPSTNLAIAIRLPKCRTSSNVAVTVELDISRKSEELDMDSEETMVMKCSEETDSITIFTGIIRLPPNTDMASLVNMPLVLIDSKEKILLNAAGLNISHDTIIVNSNDSMTDKEANQELPGDVKIKLKLENKETGMNLENMSHENMGTLTKKNISKPKKYLVNKEDVGSSEEIRSRTGSLDMHYDSVTCINDVSVSGLDLFYHKGDNAKKVGDTNASIDITKTISDTKVNPFEKPDNQRMTPDEPANDVDEANENEEEEEEEEEDDEKTDALATYDSADYTEYDYSGENTVLSDTEVTVDDLADTDAKDITYDLIDYNNEAKEGKAPTEESVNYSTELDNLTQNLPHSNETFKQFSATKASTDCIRDIINGSTNYIKELSVENLTSDNIRALIYDSQDYINELDVKGPLKEGNINNMFNAVDKPKISETDVTNIDYDSTDYVKELNDKNAKDAVYALPDLVNEPSEEPAAAENLQVIIYDSVDEIDTDVRKSLFITESDVEEVTPDITCTENEPLEIEEDQDKNDHINILDQDMTDIVYESLANLETSEYEKKNQELSYVNQHEEEVPLEMNADEEAAESKKFCISPLVDAFGFSPSYTTGKLRDTSTQYSYTCLADKEIDAQSSLFLKNWNMNHGFYNKPESSSSESTSGPNLVALPRPSQVSKSYSSAETEWPDSTTSTTTQCSSTLLSFKMDACYDSTKSDLKVPVNSPSSCTDILEEEPKLKSTKNALDFSLNTKVFDKLTLTYEKPEKTWKAVTTIASPRKSVDCPERPHYEVMDNQSAFADFSGPEDELCSTAIEYNDYSPKINPNVKYEAHKPDKTLDLLEDARFKLASFAHKNILDRHRNAANDDLIRVSTSLRDGNNKNINEKQHRELRNLDVHWETSPFDPLPNTKLEQENKNRCFEDNDEYYEKQRRDVRCYFPEERGGYIKLLPMDLLSHSEQKKNFDLYLSGDTSHKTSNMDTFYQDDLLKTQSRQKMELVRDPTTSAPICTRDSCTVICTCTLSGINSKLNSELTELQKLYDNVYSKLDSQINESRLINLSDYAISSLEASSSTEANNQETSDKTDQILLEERQQTYLNVEKDIKRVIKELLKESGDIKEAAILQGAKEEAEPPFSCELILKEPTSVTLCTTILNGIINSSVEMREQQKEEQDSTLTAQGDAINSSAEMSEQQKEEQALDNVINSSVEIPKQQREEQDATPTARDDVIHILDDLVDGIFKENVLLQVKASPSNDILNSISLLFESKEGCPNLHIGDFNCANKKTNMNQHIVYFCNAATFNSKIPKTSYSFGEAPIKDLEIPNSTFDTVTKRRDGLTITEREHSARNLETSRLFNELLSFNIQPSSENITDTQVKNEEVLNSECYIAHVNSSESQPFWDASNLSQTSIYSNTFSLYEKDLLASLPKVVVSKTSDSNENEHNENTENSEDDAQKHNQQDKPPTVEQSGTSSMTNTNIISKSKKSVKLNERMNQTSLPSTSTTIYKETHTTDEEELMDNLDLAEAEETQVSSTEPEYFIPVNIKNSKSLSENPSNIVYSPTSSDEDNSSKVKVRKVPKKTRKVDDVVVLKSKQSIISNSDSVVMVDVTSHQQPENQETLSQGSAFVLKPSEAFSNIQVNLQPQEGKTPKTNKRESPESANEGDHETVQIKLPKPRRRYKSQQELNTPQEIAEIERNVEANDRLTRRMVLSNSSPVFEYADT